MCALFQIEHQTVYVYDPKDFLQSRNLAKSLYRLVENILRVSTIFIGILGNRFQYVCHNCIKFWRSRDVTREIVGGQ